MRSTERRKVNVLEMKCLGSLVGVSLMDRVRNEQVRRRAGIERKLASRADQRLLRWFGRVEKMDEYLMVRRVSMAKVSGGWFFTTLVLSDCPSMLWWFSHGEGMMPLHDAVGIYCNKGAAIENQGSGVKYIG